jgi:D-3-phosphoglycerate dehydrogenase
MRLLIADKLHHRAIEELRTLPIDVVYEPELTKESLEQRLTGIGILIVRSTEVTAAAINNAKQLNLIVRAGAEHATIDVRAASHRGIYVANCPGKNACAVAELVFGLILALDRRIPDALASLRAGKWERTEFGKAEGLYGKTLGVAGLGAIGREVVSRARAFGLVPLVWSRSLSPARAAELGVAHAGSFEELVTRSHVLTLHVALTERTRKILSRRIVGLLPDRAIVINAARADLVDYPALLEAVEKRGIRVGLDVYPEEPRGTRVFAEPEMFRPYPSGGLVYGTPHVAAATDQAQLAIAAETVRIIRSFLLEATVPNVVNVSSSTAARFQLVIRMMDKLGTFAHVLAVLKRHGINVEEVTNTVFEGGVAACAKLRLLLRPTEACLAEIKAFEEVLHVDLVTLPMMA